MNYFPTPRNAAGGALTQEQQEQQIIQTWKTVSESCPFKCVLSGVMGFALGGAFGLFTSSMRYDSPLAVTTLQNHPSLKPGMAISDLPVREQLKHGLKDMGRTSLSSAKNFGRIGAIYSFTECCVEGLRGRNDLWNGILGGGITGGILARASGPQAVAFGAVGFAAFSGAIDWYMRSGENERRFPVI